MDPGIEEEYSSDEEENINETSNIEKLLQDFYKNYSSMKKTYKTTPILSKYEKTRILSERTQQLANGSSSYLKNPDSYNTIYDIALEELKQNKIPFIIKRELANNVELWKLEDLKVV